MVPGHCQPVKEEERGGRRREKKEGGGRGQKTFSLVCPKIAIFTNLLPGDPKALGETVCYLSNVESVLTV